MKQQILKRRQWLGLALLVTVILAVVLFRMVEGSSPTPDPGELTVVRGYGGGLKVNFFNDPAVQKVLADRYGLRVEITKEGSIEALCRTSLEDSDFIWAGDQSALAIYQRCGGAQIRTENVYNSPIVLYSWAPVVDALVTAGVALASASGVYTVNFPELIAMIQRGTTWSAIGLPDFYGQVKIKATDPARSNSGFQFAGLLATVLNGGTQVDSNSVGPLRPELVPFFRGYLTGTSETFFNQFMTQGMGALPIAVGYESQMLEYLVTNPDKRAQVTKDVRILYPLPTVWASHPFIARTQTGVELLNALLDPELQQRAWSNHGNRPGVPSVAVDTSATGLTGVMTSIASVVDMPSSDVMQAILAAIAAPPSAAPTTPVATTASSPAPADSG